MEAYLHPGLNRHATGITSWHGSVDIEWQSETHFISEELAQRIGMPRPPRDEMAGLIGRVISKPFVRALQPAEGAAGASDYMFQPLCGPLLVLVATEGGGHVAYSVLCTVLPQSYFHTGRSHLILGDGPWMDVPGVGPRQREALPWQRSEILPDSVWPTRHDTDWSPLCAASQPVTQYWSDVFTSNPAWLRRRMGDSVPPPIPPAPLPEQFMEYLQAGGPLWRGATLDNQAPRRFGPGAPLLVAAPTNPAGDPASGGWAAGP